jgi:hypothetical protein
LFLATASQTLAAAVSDFSGKRGLEKNLFCRRIFKSIIYSKESIAINLFGPAAESAAANAFIPINEKTSAEGGGNSDYEIQNGGASRSSTNFSIPIILPNTIHQCKKKNL